MKALVRRSPLDRLTVMDRVFDRFWDASLDDFFWPTAEDLGTDWQLALDLVETDKAFIVKASVPGINVDDLDVSLSGDVLTVQGKIEMDEAVERGQYYVRERRYGRFARSVLLPSPVKASKVKAEIKHGILTIHLPKSKSLQPRTKRIKIHHRPSLVEKVKEKLPKLGKA